MIDATPCTPYLEFICETIQHIYFLRRCFGASSQIIFSVSLIQSHFPKPKQVLFVHKSNQTFTIVVSSHKIDFQQFCDSLDADAYEQTSDTCFLWSH